MIKRGDFIIYQGKEYEAGKNYEENYYEIWSNQSSDLDLGFLEEEPGIYVKRLSPSEVEGAYQVDTFAEYQGLKCQLFEDENGFFLLVYNGLSVGNPKEKGFQLVDKFIYEKIVQREELTRLREEKQPLWGFSIPQE